MVQNYKFRNTAICIRLDSKANHFAATRAVISEATNLISPKAEWSGLKRKRSF